MLVGRVTANQMQGSRNAFFDAMSVSRFTIVSNGIDMKGTKKSPKSAFAERKWPKKGEKVIFKIFQHPMLWGVYPEVLMALAQNS